jgi:hypothetical protein
VKDVCEFDCKNSVIFIHGMMRRRIAGAPMGGFLSAFYAILCFALIEHQLVWPMFTSLGLPGGIKRYLDDILAVFAIKSSADRRKAGRFMEWLASSEVYPAPLKLNVEPEGLQEFLETKVTQQSGELRMMLRNSTVDDILAGKAPYRRRLPATETAPKRVVSQLISGIALRASQSCSTDSLLHLSLLMLRLEVLCSGHSDSMFWRGIQDIMRSRPSKRFKRVIKTKGWLV